MVATYSGGMPRDQTRSSEAVRITTAAASRNEDINARQKRYLLSMSLRSACFIGAVIVGPGLLCWFLIAGALVLPYIAVVLANASAPRSDGFELLDTAYGLPQLTAGSPEQRHS